MQISNWMIIYAFQIQHMPKAAVYLIDAISYGFSAFSPSSCWPAITQLVKPNAVLYYHQ